VDRKLVTELGTLRFLEDATDVLLIGPPGVGKTMLAVGLGHAAVAAGYRTYYTTATDLVARCHRAALEGRWATTMRFFAGPRLLIIDELGYLPMAGEAAAALFQVITQRYLKGSIVRPPTSASRRGAGSSTTTRWSPPRCSTGYYTDRWSSTSAASPTGCAPTAPAPTDSAPRPERRRDRVDPPGPVAGRPGDDDLPGMPGLLHPRRAPTLLQHPCRKTAFGRRHQTPAAAITVPAARPRRDYTIYECPDCGERLYGEQRCDQCGSFARRIGIGGPCPHCDQPVALSDLLDQEATIVTNR